jgi:hypothetical protein
MTIVCDHAMHPNQVGGGPSVKQPELQRQGNLEGENVDACLCQYIGLSSLVYKGRLRCVVVNISCTQSITETPRPTGQTSSEI